MGGEAIGRLWAAVSYRPSLRFHGHVFDVADSFAHHPRPGSDDVKPNRFQHWSTDRLQVELCEPSRRELLQLTNRRAAMETVAYRTEDRGTADMEHLTKACPRIAMILRNAVERLQVGPVTRMGVKLTVYADLDMLFREILEQLRPYCFPENPRFAEITSPNVEDIALSVDYERDGATVMLRLGPMKREQGVHMLESTGKASALFERKEGGEGLPQLYAAIPDDFLCFDADMYLKAESLAMDRWLSFVDSAISHIVTAYHGLKDLLLEKKQ